MAGAAPVEQVVRLRDREVVGQQAPPPVWTAERMFRRIRVETLMVALEQVERAARQAPPTAVQRARQTVPRVAAPARRTVVRAVPQGRPMVVPTLPLAGRVFPPAAASVWIFSQAHRTAAPAGRRAWAVRFARRGCAPATLARWPAAGRAPIS